jgi:gamma-glutamyl:cysteine ligase YbdK (ATP-grasp superfamily)
MHPTLKLEETGVWPHRHRKIYEAYSKLFNFEQHGWLNIQSFQLNLSYGNEKDAVRMHDLLANIVPYLPAFTASSPIYDSKFGEYVDNRLHFYGVNQQEVPSIIGDIVPEYVNSFGQYRKEIIEKYSSDMARLGADKLLLGKEWVNSRGVIFRFDRKALEIRVMDEQECIKSDVAISCFIRALMRGVFNEDLQLLPHDVLVEDFKSIVINGLRAHPSGRSARNVCEALYAIACRNAKEEEKKYLPLVRNRIDKGSLSDIIRERVEEKAQRTSFKEAVVTVYSKLAESLMDNQPYI